MQRLSNSESVPNREKRTLSFLICKNVVTCHSLKQHKQVFCKERGQDGDGTIEILNVSVTVVRW
jgi:hypothetical protein